MVGAISCGGKSDDVASQRLSGKPFIDGPLTRLVEQLYYSEYAEPCDQKNALKMLEMAKALDHRSQKIKAWAEKLDTPDRYKKIKAGPTYFYEITEADEPKDGWQEVQYGVPTSYAFYQKIKDRQVDENWWILDRRIRGQLYDDRDRIAGGRNYYLDKDSAASLSELKDEIYRCSQHSKCLFEPEINTKYFIESNPIYRSFYKVFSDAEGFEDKREVMDLFQERVQQDYDLRYGFNPNSLETARRTENNQTLYVVKIDAGDFSSATEVLTQWIERAWQSDGIQVVLDWVTSASFPSVFSILLQKGLGTRSFVDLEKREMHLAPGATDRTIVHEFGHVLGFADHYYTVWMPEECSYKDQYNEADIMSLHETGKVTPEEWAILQEQYPVE